MNLRAPNSITHSRWMQKLSMSIMIYLFRTQLNHKEFQIDNIRLFVIFGVTVYLKYWFECPIASYSPANDLEFYQKILNYPNQSIKNACLTTFDYHDQYLESNLLALSLFDNRLSREIKIKMVRNLNEEEQDVDLDSKSEICDLFNKNVLKFFGSINVDPEFLKLDPNFWPVSEDYQKVKKLIDNLNVINDTSERGCALAKKYYNTLIKDNQNKELYHVVEGDRKIRYECTKTIYNH